VVGHEQTAPDALQLTLGWPPVSVADAVQVPAGPVTVTDVPPRPEAGPDSAVVTVPDPLPRTVIVAPAGQVNVEVAVRVLRGVVDEDVVEVFTTGGVDDDEGLVAGVVDDVEEDVGASLVGVTGRTADEVAELVGVTVDAAVVVTVTEVVTVTAGDAIAAASGTGRINAAAKAPPAARTVAAIAAVRTPRRLGCRSCGSGSFAHGSSAARYGFVVMSGSPVDDSGEPPPSGSHLKREEQPDGRRGADPPVRPGRGDRRGDRPQRRRPGVWRRGVALQGGGHNGVSLMGLPGQPVRTRRRLRDETLNPRSHRGCHPGCGPAAGIRRQPVNPGVPREDRGPHPQGHLVGRQRVSSNAGRLTDRWTRRCRGDHRSSGR